MERTKIASTFSQMDEQLKEIGHRWPFQPDAIYDHRSKEEWLRHMSIHQGALLRQRECDLAAVETCISKLLALFPEVWPPSPESYDLLRQYWGLCDRATALSSRMRGSPYLSKEIVMIGFDSSALPQELRSSRGPGVLSDEQLDAYMLSRYIEVVRVWDPQSDWEYPFTFHDRVWSFSQTLSRGKYAPLIVSEVRFVLTAIVRPPSATTSLWQCAVRATGRPVRISGAKSTAFETQARRFQGFVAAALDAVRTLEEQLDSLDKYASEIKSKGLSKNNFAHC